MYTVYILISEKNHKLYVGCTSDLAKRIEKHNKGYVIATKRNIPYTLLHKEIYENKGDAFQRERFLKSLWSSRFKNKLKQSFLQSKNYG